MQRRQFLGASFSSLVVACSARTDLGPSGDDSAPISQWSEPIEVDESRFPQSIASGDPKPSSVILWTRAPYASAVYAQVALDAEFTKLVSLEHEGQLVAEVPVAVGPEYDHCVKLRVNNLEPETVYYYRFVSSSERGVHSSRIGRTKTAPGPSSDASPRFLVLSCQDYNGYYHALRRGAELVPDFIVHLGDYIYETTSDPSFQEGDGHREIAFRDVSGALAVAVAADAQTAARRVLAARSLDNYRQLYQTYRGDRALQLLHETAPIVAVCDDHEFANDSTRDRTPVNTKPDPERRSNADQAWFEYMPVDYPEAPALHDAPSPDNLRMYRDLRFGKHVHLVMTDLRRYRPPHLLEEDAFPGAVLVDEPTLVEFNGNIPDFARPYVDLDVNPNSSVSLIRAALRDAANGWDLDRDVFSGKQDVAYLNTWIERYNTENPSRQLALFGAEVADGRGLAAVHVGKSELSSSFGARYLVIQAPFEVLAKVRYAQTNGASELVMGAQQREWFLNSLRSSTATWKIWGNEYTFLRKVADLSVLPLPDERFRHKFLLSVEDWDGAPNERLALLDELSQVNNLAIVTGDIHSFFVGSPGVGESSSRQPHEFVCGAVSSATYERLLSGLVQIDGFGDIAPVAATILELSNPHVAYNDLKSNGFALVEANSDELTVTFHALPSGKVLEPALDSPLADHFTTQTFTWTKDGKLEHAS
jgi:alkaline phosphatase D